MKYIAAMEYRRRREAAKQREALLAALGETEAQVATDESAASTQPASSQLPDEKSTDAVMREDLPARVRAAYLKAESYKKGSHVVAEVPTEPKPKLARFTEAAMAQEIALKD